MKGGFDGIAEEDRQNRQLPRSKGPPGGSPRDGLRLEMRHLKHTVYVITSIYIYVVYMLYIYISISINVYICMTICCTNICCILLISTI